MGSGGQTGAHWTWSHPRSRGAERRPERIHPDGTRSWRNCPESGEMLGSHSETHSGGSDEVTWGQQQEGPQPSGQRRKGWRRQTKRRSESVADASLVDVRGVEVGGRTGVVRVGRTGRYGLVGPQLVRPSRTDWYGRAVPDLGFGVGW